MSEEIDYSKYSDKELIEMYKEEMDLSEQYNASQLVKKILLNSCYGALGSPYFSLYKLEIARGITLLGQMLINKSAKSTNEYISKVLREKTVVDRRIYSDTDSVTGDTKIMYKIVNGNHPIKMAISTFYDIANGSVINKNKEIKLLQNLYFVKTVDGEEIKYTPISYISKHKTNKKLYKITIGNKSVTVTEDHSIMFYRDGVLQSGTVKELQSTDELVMEE